MIERSKLKPYNGTINKSFEQLCYQIAKKEFGDNGLFTAIDGSGGDGGIEFYLTLENGDVRGWQCKFFSESGRLNVSNRKKQIENSLQKACLTYPRLTKWTLCLKTDLTEDSKDKNGRETNGERTRFNDLLKSIIPNNMNTNLEFWGESEFNNFLRIHGDVYRFFFDEKILNDQRFYDRYLLDIEKTPITAKYISDIHIGTEVDDTINKVLGGKRLIKLIEDSMSNLELESCDTNYIESHNELFREDVSEEYIGIQIKIRDYMIDKKNIIRNGISKLQEIINLIAGNVEHKELLIKIKEFEQYNLFLRTIEKNLKNIRSSSLCDILKYVEYDYETINEEYFPFKKYKGIKKYSYTILNNLGLLKKHYHSYQKKIISLEKKEINEKIESIINRIFGPYHILSDVAISSLERCSRIFELINSNELHISGDAGMGKTHISFNIYEDRIKNLNEPAIFLFAKDFIGDHIEEQIKKLLDIPTSRSFDDFLGELETCAVMKNVKIPLIIDGLNESDQWEKIWKNGLESLILKIRHHYEHIVLITTYRSSYEEELFTRDYIDANKNKIIKTYGFKDLSSTAIRVYFDYYKIDLSNHSDAIGYLEHPLHLKLFCITKNLERKSRVKVSFQHEDLFEVFDEYIAQSNQNITNRLSFLDPKYDKEWTQKKLLEFSKLLWEKKTRGISYSALSFNKEELKAFESENLLIFREWNVESKIEEIQFTYDLLGGYFISKYLVNTYRNGYDLVNGKSSKLMFRVIGSIFERITNAPESMISILSESANKLNSHFYKKGLLKFCKSKEFKGNLLDNDEIHPLFDDILRSISILLIKEHSIYLFDILKSEKAKKYSIESLFEINQKYIVEYERRIKDFLKKGFNKTKNKEYFFRLFHRVELNETHPLNYNFFSGLLKGLTIADRDIYRTEFIRFNDNAFYKFIKNFELACKENRKLPVRIHIAAKKIMWMLTSTIRNLRDDATKGLYYYSRKYPKQFYHLLDYSLSINDPYVYERMLAVVYGLCMAKYFEREFHIYLKDITLLLYKNIFSENATLKTTHILARDYAKRSIDLGLIIFPDLLTKEQKQKLIYPMHQYDSTVWGESQDMNDNDYRDGDKPIHMDFENYTIGRLVTGRSNYNMNHTEYKIVLSNIRRRIYNLGYSLDKFSKIDQNINRSNYYNKEQGKVDRYGKKYSWIAFFELAGYRADLGLLDYQDGDLYSRISDLDLDPSFPVEMKDNDIIAKIGIPDLLGKASDPIEWCNNININLNTLFIDKKNFFGNTSEGILLNGIIDQKDQENSRTKDIHVSISTLLLSKKDIAKIKDILQYDDYEFEYINHIETYYTYEGEFPYTDTVPEDNLMNLTITYNNRIEKIVEEKLEYKLKGDIINNEREVKKIEDKIRLLFLKKNPDQEDYQAVQIADDEFIFMFELDNDIKIRLAKELGYELKLIKINKEIEKKEFIELKNIKDTIIMNNWKSYHSDINPQGQTLLPSKEICKSYSGIYLKPQTSDLYYQNGLFSKTFGIDNSYNDKIKMLYIKKEILNDFCKKNSLIPVHFQWIEKRYFPGGIDNYNTGSSMRKTFCKIYI